MKKNILLLDGYNLIYRARYSGMNKGNYSTIFNFFRGLRPLIEKFSPDNCYFVLEGKPVKRLELDPNYKGQRVYHNKDNFNEQRNTIIDLLNKYFPITIAKHEDYECDDIIGYLANNNSDNNVTIVSSDTDFIQCINENISLYNPVKKKYIEKPNYDYVLWKSLKGDDLFVSVLLFRPGGRMEKIPPGWKDALRPIRPGCHTSLHNGVGIHKAHR